MVGVVGSVVAFNFFVGVESVVLVDIDVVVGFDVVCLIVDVVNVIVVVLVVPSCCWCCCCGFCCGF